MTRICFVTNEIYPAKRGGIGRLMHNFAEFARNASSPVDLHFLISASETEHAHRIVETYESIAAVHLCRGDHGRNDLLGQMLGRIPPDDPQIHECYRESVAYYLGLREIERECGPIDIVEFPDFGGWAAASLAAKMAGLSFQNTQFAVRLHSTMGLITRFERFSHYPSIDLGFMLDLERWCLAHADTVVGHLETIADRNAEHYRFPDSWRQRVKIEFPPILDPAAELPGHATGVVPAPEHPADFLFASRYQPFKRPDLFIHAAVSLIDRFPEYQGRFVLAAYGWDEGYISYLQRLIPRAHASRIPLLRDVSAQDRAALLRNSTVVIPSDYESLCVLAYEVAMSGAGLILNGNCEAFGKGPRWRDRENCLLFDGTVRDLARAMQDALEWTPASSVDVSVDVPYWMLPRSARHSSTDAADTQNDHQLAVAVWGCFTPDDVGQAVSALSLAIPPQTEVCFLLPGSQFREDDRSCSLIRRHGWRRTIVPGDGSDCQAMHARLLGISCDSILMLPYDYRLHAGYIPLAISAMKRCRNLALFSTHVRILSAQTGDPVGLRMFGGSLPSWALAANRVAPGAVVIRRKVLERYEFDLRARSAWFEEFVRRLCLAGEELLIAPSVQLDVRDDSATLTESDVLTAGLGDRYLRELGSDVRFLGLDSVTGHRRNDATGYAGTCLLDTNRAQLVWPSGGSADADEIEVISRDRSAVEIRSHHGIPFIVSIETGPQCRGVILRAEYRNPDSTQDVEVAAAFMADVPGTQGLESLLLNAVHDDITISEWVRLEGGGRSLIELTSLALPGTNSFVMLMARLPTCAAPRKFVVRVEHLSRESV